MIDVSANMPGRSSSRVRTSWRERERVRGKGRGREVFKCTTPITLCKYILLFVADIKHTCINLNVYGRKHVLKAGSQYDTISCVVLRYGV